MNNKKVVPITGKHTSMHSMLAEAMTNDKAKRGAVIFFDEGRRRYEFWRIKPQT